MKTKSYLILTAVFSLMLFSCDWFTKDDDGKTFWAQNIVTNKHYSISAEMLVEGTYCNVWAEIGSGVSKATAQNIANIYDNNIYQKMINNFSAKNFNFSGYTFSNIIELADELADGDGKLCILLLDIKDGYEKDKNESYAEGYFWAGNFLNIEGSNLCDMIYIDTYPGKPGSEASNMTLAHEMQHLMNFTTTILRRSESNDKGQLTDIFPMDTWIDEGLSSAAEWVYLGKHVDDKIAWFKNASSNNYGLINKGNNFFVWNNRGHNENCASNCNDPEHNQYAILDDYATVYLFFQWLRLQDSVDIYKKIITSPYNDYNAVVNNISVYNTWDSLLGTWLAANKINSSSGQYGYKGEIDVKVTYAPKNISSLQLYPGEGVYSLANTQPNTTPNTNIVYRYITNSAVNSNFSNGSTLLTYNKNTKKDGAAENGTVTGAAPAASVNITNTGRSVSAQFSGPYRIDAGDLLRRGGSGMGLSIENLPVLQKRPEIDE